MRKKKSVNEKLRETANCRKLLLHLVELPKRPGGVHPQQPALSDKKKPKTERKKKKWKMNPIVKQITEHDQEEKKKKGSKEKTHARTMIYAPNKIEIKEQERETVKKENKLTLKWDFFSLFSSPRMFCFCSSFMRLH